MLGDLFKESWLAKGEIIPGLRRLVESWAIISRAASLLQFIVRKIISVVRHFVEDLKNAGD